MSVLTLNQQIRNGLSNARNSSQFINIDISTTETSRLVGGGSRLGTDVTEIIERANQAQTVKEFQFPTDMPKYHFRLLENEWDAGLNSGSLRIERYYTLPLPMQGIQDDFSVNYDTNFSPLQEVRDAFQGPSNLITGTIATITGRTLNTFKTITLAAPDFREFSLSWKLAPKTFDEAQSIQRIYWSLRRGMTPRTQFEKALFVFPKIYTMYFVPNVRYLYKFKPCVLRNLSVNFTGGNPHPTFYKRQGPISESPPESVIITMTFLELEYWRQQDVDDGTGADDLPTSNPFDIWNFYEYNSENPITT